MKVKDLMDLLHSAEAIIDTIHCGDLTVFSKTINELSMSAHGKADLQAKLSVLSARVRHIRDLNINIS